MEKTKGNEFASSMSIAGSEVQLDTQVKRVLAQKQVLAWIMKFTVREFMQFPLDVIQECMRGRLKYRLSK